MHLRSFALLALSTTVSWAQLTTDQKISDFQQMTGLFAKGYGPHDWKKSAFGTDLFDTARWLDRIRATKDDLEFYEVMSRWVAQLDDAHDSYANPSNYLAQLNFFVDLYDGKLLIDSTDRVRLPAGQYPLVNGYELVSIDGEDATKILERMLPYAVSANPRSTRRTAAELITWRPQGIIPQAHLTPDYSTVVFRRFDGRLETYRMQWTKTGVPMTSVGKFPGYTPATAAERRTAGETPPPVDEQTAFMQVVDRLINFRLPHDRAVVSFGSLSPVFSRSMPGTFIQRLGRTSADPFYSGTFDAGGYRIGFIRIPSFAPSDLTGALTVFTREIAYFQDNTDGLIVDVMRNPGGSSSYAGALLNYLMFYQWRTLGLEIRATSVWIRDISNALESLKAQNAPASLISGFEEALNALIEANRENRALSRPVPWDFNPNLERQALRDSRGNLVAYYKPMMVLIDEFSASAADGFAAIIQDNGRAPLFGWRTMGAGGNVTSWTAGSYSRGFVTLTESLMSRAYERAEDGGYPVSRYVENVGVRPEIEVDYMTRDNLIQNGKPFVDAFVAAMVEHLRSFK